MVIGAAGQMVARIAREAGEDLSRVYLRDVRLKISAKMKKWRRPKAPGTFLPALLWLFYAKDRTGDKEVMASSWVRHGAGRQHMLHLQSKNRRGPGSCPLKGRFTPPLFYFRNPLCLRLTRLQGYVAVFWSESGVSKLYSNRQIEMLQQNKTQLKCRRIFKLRYLFGSKHDTAAHQMDVLTRLWQLLHGWAGLAGCEKADVFIFGSQGFFFPRRHKRCAVDKPKARAAPSCSLTCPWCTVQPSSLHSLHHFSRLCCPLKCSHPSLRPSLSLFFFFFSVFLTLTPFFWLL